MIKKFINGESSSITSAAFIIGVTTLAAKFLGLLRDSIIANRFHVADTDIYYAAFRIPDFIYSIIVLGALSAGFIPVFAKLIASGKKEEAFKAASNVLNILFIILLGCTVASLIFAPQIISFLTPGFDPEKKRQTVELTRIMFLSPIFMLLSSITTGILQSYKRFLVCSLSPIFYNLGIILGAEVLAGKFGLRGLAWGVPLGAFLQFAIQFPSVKMLGYRYKFIIDTKSREVRTIMRMMVPRILTLIVSQVNFLAITVIGSTLMGGSISVFNYANNLQSFPLGIFAISFAVASFPTLSAFSSKEQREDFTSILLSTTRKILYFIIPLSVFLIVFRAQAVRVILGHGQFGWSETIATINALEIFCVSLFAQSLIPLFSRAFWALHDSRTPFYTSVVSALLNILLAVELAPAFGISGLVWAFSISNILNAAALFFLLKRDGLSPIPKNFYANILSTILATTIAGTVGYVSLYAIEPLLDTHTFTGILTQGALAGSMSLGAYFLMSSYLQIEEFRQLGAAFQSRILKTNIRTTEIIPEE
jgi:putative peptidoglycan lipid II flippase